MNQDQVFVRGLVVDTIIGVLPHERTTRQPLEIDLQLSMDIDAAAQSDDLKDALDYAQLSERLSAYVRSTNFQLIERLAHEIINWLWQYPAIAHIALELRKPQALLTAQTVGIRLARGR
ncbi:MAG: dihydroneopterin aldolase [Pseudomonadota bacterium]|nr:dihydroneopterin aldolase [Pseudomonadota bacterium]